jgi:hypothetical protein
MANAVEGITSLRNTAAELQSESEKKYNFVTEQVQKKVDSLNAQADKIQADIIAKLTEAGLCSDQHGTGLTAKDAEHPFFADVDSLWEIGNGDWC